jgi:hypothetical protein
MVYTICTVAYFLKARTVEPEKQPLLANGSEITFVSRQRGMSPFLRSPNWPRPQLLASHFPKLQLSTDSTSTEVKIMLRPTVSWPVCLGVKHPFGAQDQISMTVRQLRICWCGALSLMTGRVCRLQLLLALASAVILGSESRGTHEHILLSQIRDSTNLECQLLTQALSSLFVASYDSQSYSKSPPQGLNHNSVNYFSSLYSPGMDRTENVFSIILCCLVAGETTCPQSCSLSMAVAQSPVYTAVT